MNPFRPIHPKIREERVKLAAAGCQNLAIALSIAVLLAPTINPSLTAPPLLVLCASSAAGVLEIAAISMMRYIVTKESRHDRP
jgi:hypothetical protein